MSKSVLFVRTLKHLVLRVFVVSRVISLKTLNTGALFVAALSFVGAVWLSGSGHYAYAVTNDTLNFQARLQTSNGAIAGDGTYNVQFKLYSASTGGTALWTEDYLNSNTQGVRVANGYLTVNLGSITSFPNTIPWDQQLYVTMNIGGTTTTATWDGEMNPRLKLTAVPYAMNAKTASSLVTTSGALSSSLSIQAPTGGNQIFQIPDQGAAGTYTLLTGAAANGSFIQNQTSSDQSASFRIDGSGRANTFTANSTVTVGSATTQGQMALHAGNSFTTTIKAGLSAANLSFILPSGAGSNGNCLLTDGAGQTSWGSCSGGTGSGVTTVGTLDSQAKSNDGAFINATTIYMQTAQVDKPGLVGTGAQTFAGNKTFQDGITLATANTAQDRILIAAANAGTTRFDGTITNADLTAARTWTLPDASGTILTTGNMSSITAVGTITSGAWNGAAIDAAHGGTGMTSAGAAGTVIYSNGTNLANTAVGTSGQCLTSGASGAPTWSSCTAGAGGTTMGGDVTGTVAANTVSKLQGTTLTISSAAANQTLVYDGTAWKNSMLSNANLTAGAYSNITGVGTITSGTWNGTAIDAAHGGTGQSSYVVGDLLYANSTTTLGRLADVSSGQCLLSGGVGVAPTWGSCSAAAGGANTSLSNLTATSINQSLLASANNTLDLGSSSLAWRNGYFGSMVYGPGFDVATAGALNIGTTNSTSLTIGKTGAYTTTINGNTVVVSGLTAGLVQSSAGGTLTSGAVDRNSAAFFSNALSVANGGTGATTASGARINLGAAASGANGDITSLSGLTTALSVGQGGTGATSLTQFAVLLGNGTGALQATAVGSTGQCLLGNTGAAPTWGSCGLGSEADTLATVTARGATTATASSFTGGAIIRGITVDTATATQDRIVISAAATGAARFDGTITNADLTAARTYTLPDASGTIAVSASGNIALSAAGNISFTGTLPIANGGTNTTTIGANGSIAYSNGAGYSFSGVGTNGQCLQSSGAGAPTWGSCGLGSEADTLATVTGRGATTSTASTFSGGLTVGSGLGVTGGLTASGTIRFSSLTTAGVLVNDATGTVTSTPALADNQVSDTLTVGSASTVDWTALNNYPAACAAGSALTALGDTVTCQSFGAASGNGNYIQNSTTTQVANFNIQSTAVGTPTAVIKQLASQTADLLQFQNSSGTTIAVIDKNGNLSAVAGAFTGALSASNFSGTHSGTSSGTNTGDVTLAGQNYLSIAGQTITAAQINLTSHVTGVLPATNGGTGINTYAQGDILLGGATANTLTKLAIGGSGTCLTSNGTIASWASCSAASGGANTALSNLASTNINTALNTTSGNLNITTTTSGNIVLNSAGTIELQDNTNVTGNLAATGTVTGSNLSGTHSGTSSGTNTGDVTLSGQSYLTLSGQALTANQVNLTTHVTGTLPVANGGTGATTLTANGVLYGNGTSAVGATAAGTTGQCLLATTGAAPSWGTCTGTGANTSLSNLTATSVNQSLVAGTNNTLDLGSSTNTWRSGYFGTSAVIGTSSLQGQLVLQNGNTFTTTLKGGATASNIAFTLPTTTGSNLQCMKTDGAGQLSFGNCNNGSGSGGSVTLQDAYNAGNNITTTDARGMTYTFADTATDASMVFNLQCATCSASGGRFAVQNGGSDVFVVNPNSGGVLTKVSSAAAFAVQNAAGTATALAVNTNNNTVIIGSNASDPATPANGAMYYNTSLNKFRCYINGAWADCDSTGGTPSGPAGGDLSGTYPNPTVAKVNGQTVTYTSLAANQLFVYNGSAWVNGTTAGDVTNSVTGNTNTFTIANSAVTSAKILDATITGTDIAASAIANSNLANSSITVANGTNITGGTTVALGGTVTVGVVNNPTFSGLITANGGITLGANTVLTNQGATLNSSMAIADVAAGGAIGTAAATVDVATTFNVNQTTAGQTLTLPSPTTTTAGRIVYVNNVGAATFTMYGVSVGAAKSQGYIWNGTAWTPLGVDGAGSGATSVNPISGTSNANGATISGGVLTLTAADATNGGVVTNTTQTFAGAKTFQSAASFTAAGTGLAVTNNMTVGGTISGATGITSSGAITFSGLSTAGIVTNTAGGVLGTVTSIPITNGGTGATTAQTAINNLSGLTTNGDILYHNGTNSTRLARGTSGQCLTSTATTIQWGGCGLSVEADTLGTVTGRGATTTTASSFQGGATIRTLTVDTATATDDLISVAVTPGGVGRFTGTITNADLTANRTWTLPDTTGTVITTGNLSSITATGIVASGTWQGTAVGVGYGGTGLTSYTTGDLIYASGATTLGKLTAVASGSCLVSSGVGAAPTWGSCGLGSEADTLATVTARGATTATASSFTGGATIRGITVDTATATQDRIIISAAATGAARFDGTITNADLTAARTYTLPDASGTIAVSASGNIALSAAGNISFTGTLPISNGGTGATTLTANGVLYGNGTSAVGATAAGTTGQCLLATTGAAPSWGTCTGAGANTALSNLSAVNIGATALNSTANNLNLTTTTSGNIVINSAGTIELQDATNVTGNLSATGTINTNTLTATNLSFSGANPSITAGTANTNILLNANGTGQVQIGGTSTGDILLGGGSASTGCTLTNSSGALACTAAVTGSNLSGNNTGDVTLAGQTYLSIAGQVITANQINLTTNVTGTLPIASGGTGATTVQVAINNLSGLTTNGDLLYSDGTNSIRLARGTNGQCLTSNATTLQWGSCGAAITVGALDGGTANATGATISGSTIFLQSASATMPGLVNTTTQTFTGDKTFKSTTNSAAAFAIQSSSGTSLFTADTTNSRVYVGPVAGDTTGVILILGNKTTAGDPTGLEGAMYYNSATKDFRCYANSGWKNCNGLSYETVELKDEFISTRVNGVNDRIPQARNMGELNWICDSDAEISANDGNFGCEMNNTAEDANHPGVNILRTNVTSSGWATNMILSPVFTSSFDRMTYIVRTSANVTTRDKFFIGMVDDMSSNPGTGVSQPNSGIYFRYTGTTIETIVCNSTTCTNGTTATITNTALTPVANTWYRFEIRRNASNNYEFYINDTLYTTSPSTYQPSAPQQPMMEIKNRTTQEAMIYIDYFSMRTRAITR